MTRIEFDDKLNEIIDILEVELPETDPEHKSEILDIAELLKARAYKYVDNYGLG